jgi:hypothetical protein
MTKPALWDEEFLKKHEHFARLDAIEKLTEFDWQASVQRVTRRTADILRGYVTCPAAKCRRARRCVGDGVRCVDQLEQKLPWEIEDDMIRKFYASIQRARRKMAEEAEAE